MKTGQPDFIELNWNDRTVQIEYRFLGNADSDVPLIIFLHEGLGSLSQWRDFPSRLCKETECRGLVYSRPGYGHSTSFDGNEFWGTDFMHRQAYEVLPSFIAELNIDCANSRIWLFGHSDGASIALLYSAAFPDFVEGLIAVAPHIMVEEVTVKSIRRLKDTYHKNSFRKKFAAHHADPDSTFYGWTRVWLDPTFRSWSIESHLSDIRSPVLIIQGTDDEYGTINQVVGISSRLNNAMSVQIPDCGHAPHRTHPDALLTYSAQFMQKNTPSN